MADTLLSLRNIRAGYGESVVLDNISLDISQGGSLAVLGRNGVGKSTLILTIMGFTNVTSGVVEWQGQDITKTPSYRRAHNGLGWISQERDIFPSLSVEENLTVVARPGNWTLDKIFDLFPRLKERSNHMGNHLSGGEQQMLAIARTLMTNPALLLLDEPLEGLAPIIVEELSEVIKQMVTDENTAIILVEQHADIALSLTQNAIVIERGVIAHSGPSGELLEDHASLDRFIGLNLAEIEAN